MQFIYKLDYYYTKKTNKPYNTIYVLSSDIIQKYFSINGKIIDWNNTLTDGYGSVKYICVSNNSSEYKKAVEFEENIKKNGYPISPRNNLHTFFFHNELKL